MDAYKRLLTFDYEESRDFLFRLNESKDLALLLDDKKHVIIGEDNLGEKILEFRLPLPFSPLGQYESLEEYLKTIEEVIPNYLILLIQAGSAAIGYFEEGVVDNHKVIRKYMIRAKQGKAQVKHLKTKGKSRLGSRIRLSQTEQFFEEINGKLQDWEVEDVDKILYSASIQLWNLVFQSKVSAPFEKDDIRLCKIPLDIKQPNYEELLLVNNQVLQGTLKIYQEIEGLINS